MAGIENLSKSLLIGSVPRRLAASCVPGGFSFVEDIIYHKRIKKNNSPQGRFLMLSTANAGRAGAAKPSWGLRNAVFVSQTLIPYSNIIRTYLSYKWSYA